MRKLRAGIVGCGGIANGKHLPAMQQSGLYEVVAFCDIIIERAQETKEKFGTEDAKVFEDYRELLKEDLDVVYVTTPNRSHAEISIAAMEAGRDVMCEKPMAKNYAEAQKMVETAERTHRVLNIAYQNRYRTDSLYLKEMCKSDELGEIYFAKAHALRRRAVPTWGVSAGKRAAQSVICGVLIGFICGFIGAGGGMMMLLILTSVLGYELKTAVGTSVFIMAFTAFTGAASHFAIGGAPDWTVLILCVLFTLIWARIAAVFANKATPKTLNRATGVILVLLGIVVMLFSAIA